MTSQTTEPSLYNTQSDGSIKVIAAGHCDSAQPWVLLHPPVRAQGFIESVRCPAQHVIPLPHAFSLSVLFLSRMPANLYPDFHMKEAVGVNSAASKSSVKFLCLVSIREGNTRIHHYSCDLYPSNRNPVFYLQNPAVVFFHNISFFFLFFLSESLCSVQTVCHFANC